jgi:histidine triad (HIT) family protein
MSTTDLWGCVFCRIVAGDEPAKVVAEWPDAIAIVPLNPVADGHLLVIPRAHIKDAAEEPAVAGLSAQRAAELMHSSVDAFNLITSAGLDATQTVMHLHWHVVPRSAGDGLALPWSPGGAS